MKLTGEKLIPQPRAAVWAALNNLDVLKASIPGCHEIEQIGDDEYALVIAIAVGPVKAKFKGKLHLTNIVAPQSYSLTFQGAGAAVGFGKGVADVSLRDQDGGTSLNYGVEAQVGGKIAQVGARLIDGVAAKMADEFFTAFEQCLAGPMDTESGAQSSEETENEDDDSPQAKRSRWKFWERRRHEATQADVSEPVPAKHSEG